MSRRADTWHDFRAEVICAGDPAGALLAAVDQLHSRRPGEIWSIGVSHDDGCPSLNGRGMPACTCAIVELEARRAA